MLSRPRVACMVFSNTEAEPVEIRITWLTYQRDEERSQTRLVNTLGSLVRNGSQQLALDTAFIEILYDERWRGAVSSGPGPETVNHVPLTSLALAALNQLTGSSQDPRQFASYLARVAGDSLYSEMRRGGSNVGEQDLRAEFASHLEKAVRREPVLAKATELRMTRAGDGVVSMDLSFEKASVMAAGRLETDLVMMALSDLCSNQ